MGGDFGLRVSLPAACQALLAFPDLEILLVGDSQAIESNLSLSVEQQRRVRIVHAEQVVSMAEKPSFALRHRRSSSMWCALELLSKGEADAGVSAGNTGALMAMGGYVLKTLPGIDRPAICSAIPTKGGLCYLLDLGANVDSSAEQLRQFAVMGSAMVSAVHGIDSPRVALLNIGEESIKGNEQVRLAARMLEADKQLNYCGFVEGDGLFAGNADVVVCDGFVGNVALKTCEGTARYITQLVQHELGKSWIASMCLAILSPSLKRIFRKLDPDQYNGASFLGLQGVVVKSHGASSAESFFIAIRKARAEVEQNMLERIDRQIAALVD
jgi:glycerol-3-phosphate acyltransferase PlsX